MSDELQWVVAPEVPEIYTNSVRIHSTVYDFVVELALRSPDATSARVLARVRMSPQHAWVAAQLLQRNLEEYIKQVGPIPVRHELLKDLNLVEQYERDMGVME